MVGIAALAYQKLEGFGDAWAIRLCYQKLQRLGDAWMMGIAALAYKKKKKENMPRNDLIQRVRTTPAKRRGTGENYGISFVVTASRIITC